MVNVNHLHIDDYALVLIEARSEAQSVRSSVVFETVGSCHFRYLRDISNSHLNLISLTGL